MHRLATWLACWLALASAGAVYQLQCFAPPHPQETLMTLPQLLCNRAVMVLVFVFFFKKSTCGGHHGPSVDSCRV